MKPGNLRVCKVPSPAVRRKMRLDFSFFARPGIGARFLYQFETLFQIEAARTYRTRLAGDASFGRCEGSLCSPMVFLPWQSYGKNEFEEQK